MIKAPLCNVLCNQTPIQLVPVVVCRGGVCACVRVCVCVCVCVCVWPRFAGAALSLKAAEREADWTWTDLNRPEETWTDLKRPERTGSEQTWTSWTWTDLNRLDHVVDPGAGLWALEGRRRCSRTERWGARNVWRIWTSKHAEWGVIDVSSWWKLIFDSRKECLESLWLHFCPPGTR